MGGADVGPRFAIIEPAGKVLPRQPPGIQMDAASRRRRLCREVYDAQFNLVSSSPLLTGLSWTAPQLARGQVYSWQVKAVKGGQEFIAPSCRRRAPNSESSIRSQPPR